MQTSGMLKLKNIFLLIFPLLLITYACNSRAVTTISLANGETLQLIGIGMYKELRNDIYIGALYGPKTVRNADQLKSEQISSRMSLRFVSKYSHRKLARHWKEKMAMNNSRAQWQPLTHEIVDFSKLFMRSMQAGDELNIDYIPQTGTQVYLNGTLFSTIKKPAFFTTLLNVWLGNLPPTKAFKKSIRGDDSEVQKQAYITQYDNLFPVKGRFDDDLTVIDVALAAATAPSIISTNNKKITKVAKVDPSVKTTKKEASKKRSTTRPQKGLEKIARNRHSTKTEAPLETKVPLIKKTAKDKSTAKKKNLIDKQASTKKLATKEKVPTKKKTRQEPKVAKKQASRPEQNKTDFFDADLIAGSYSRDLINTIRKHQKYPIKALREGKQGDVLAKVTINAEGELLSIELLENSGSRVLDRGAKKIISRSAPFQPIPKALKLEQYVFEVPMSFKL